MILRRTRLRFWLWAMAWCERTGRTESPAYHWVVRRAMRCNRWGWKWDFNRGESK